ncbi:MAG: PIN domain-containing protein [Gemmatimonadales bacterium]
MIYLDTNFLIGALDPLSLEQRRIREWVARRRIIRASSVAWAEFLCGPVRPEDIRLAGTIIGEPMPFAAGDGNTAAWLFNRSGRRRGTLLDCMIAAAAINASASLATNNVADFERFVESGLELA